MGFGFDRPATKHLKYVTASNRRFFVFVVYVFKL